ncbi:MAG: glycosyltransferase family 9 protein [Bacteroidia bacterium]
MALKVLIIRFSAIGDVVLTTPVIRSLYKQIPEVEIHYLTKKAQLPLLEHNPYVHTVHVLEDSFSATIAKLKKVGFDHILDLHHNIRSWRVKRALEATSTSFDKKNKDKWLLCQPRLRYLAKPIEHIVPRYADTLAPLGAELDQDGLDFFLPEGLEEWAAKELTEKMEHVPRLAIVLGASFATKRWEFHRFIDLIDLYKKPVLLIGGPDMKDEAFLIEVSSEAPVFNAVGEYGLLESAALMKTCPLVLSHDTGFMHIAAAFKQKVISLWGNTVPEFGMTPYETPHAIVEVERLNCRPCSKLGYGSCPKGHFACMDEIKPAEVLQEIYALDAASF